MLAFMVSTQYCIYIQLRKTSMPEKHLTQRMTHKGRGTQGNPPNRFAALKLALDEEIENSSTVTECRPVKVGKIISRNTSPDVPFSQSINPYQGCEHGCVYCYARPSHAYLDLSPGLDFETRLTCKPEAAHALRRELSRPGYRCQGITLGANTDPYQPVEKNLGITRQLLEVMLETRHPVALITRSPLITRDLDILKELAQMGLCSVAMSVTTLDDELKRKLEPRAPSGRARLKAMAQLCSAGIPVSLLAAPMIPAINDREMENIVAAAAAAGATNAAYILLRLPLEVSQLFQEWLEQHYPLRAQHVMSLLRQSRGGRDNDPRFGYRMRGEGEFAALLAQRFKLACKRHGLSEGEVRGGRTDLFTPPCAGGDQFDLFS